MRMIRAVLLALLALVPAASAQELRGHGGPVRAAAVSADGSRALTGSFDQSAIAQATFPEIQRATAHLREVLGEQTYRSLARAGAGMTSAARATYALEQIDLTRARLQQT